MADLISRAAAIDAVLSEERYCERNMDDETTAAVQMAKFKLEKVPVVDAAPVVHARWIDYKDDHQCSACKEHTIFDAYVWKAIQFEFCPWCGAKMDGERRDDDAAD